MRHHLVTLRASLAVIAVVIGCSADRDDALVDSGRADVGVDSDAAVDVRSDLADVAAREVDATASDSGCNPIAEEWDCLLPFPSDAFLVDGHVSISAAAMPADKSGFAVTAFDRRTADGFSVHPSILFTLGSGIDPDSLVGQEASEVSVTPQSATILLDTTTGEAVPHFSEVYLGEGEDMQIGAIRPLVRLHEGRRYVVAVQSVRLVDGTEAEPPTLFRALRDDSSPAMADELRARFDAEVFAPLETFGVVRADLDLAWDFTTRTRNDLIGDMLSVRAGTLEWLDTNTPNVTITEVNEGADLGANLEDHTFRHVEGTFTAPLWTETDDPGARLVGPFGDREIAGTIEVPFTVTIPKSIAEDSMRTGPFLQFGHGFFGRRQEVISFVQSKFGDDYRYVIGAVDWLGMTRADRDWIIGELVTSPSAAFEFIPRVHQGMANQLVFTEVVRTLLPEQDALMVGDRVAFEPEQLYFLGISQGHILGGTFMALTPSIERAVLNVGGASLGLILTRSYAFFPFERILGQWLEPLELRKFEALATQVLEPIDPIAFAPLVLSDPLDGTVSKQMLLQGGVADPAVPNASTELHARALGIGLVTPSVVEIPFMDEVAAPASSGLTMFEFGLDPSIGRDWDAVRLDNEVHEAVRRYVGARNQMSQFLRPDGQIEDTCSGPCVVP